MKKGTITSGPKVKNNYYNTGGAKVIKFHNIYITDADYEAAAMIGVTKRLLDSRVRTYYWDKERAITTPKKVKNSRKKWIDIALKNNIGRSTFYRRVNGLGWTEEDAATRELVINKNDNRLAKYGQEVSDNAIKNGISTNTFRSRIKLGWTLEEASTILPLKYGQVYKIKMEDEK